MRFLILTDWKYFIENITSSTASQLCSDSSFSSTIFSWGKSSISLPHLPFLAINRCASLQHSTKEEEKRMRQRRELPLSSIHRAESDSLLFSPPAIPFKVRRGDSLLESFAAINTTEKRLSIWDSWRVIGSYVCLWFNRTKNIMFDHWHQMNI